MPQRTYDLSDGPLVDLSEKKSTSLSPNPLIIPTGPQMNHMEVQQKIV
jgi:hypothetical protein